MILYLSDLKLSLVVVGEVILSCGGRWVISKKSRAAEVCISKLGIPRVELFFQPSVTSLICNIRVKEKNSHGFCFYFNRSYFPVYSSVVKGSH